MAGKLQNEDHKSLAELTGAGGSAAQLLNDSKIYVTAGGINKQLSQAITDGDIGGGGGSKNYIGNAKAESGTTGWATYADAAASSPVDGTGGSPNITWTQTSSSPLEGTYSFLLTKDAANRQGEGVSYDFTIDLGDDNGGVFVASCSYMPTSGTFSGGSETTDSDVTVYIVSKEFGTVIQPSYYKLQASVNGKAAKSTAYFQLPVSAGGGSARQFRLCYHVATVSTAAYTVKFDEVSVGPSAGAGVQSAQNLCSYTHGGGQTINTSWATILFGTKTVDDNALYNTGTGVLTFAEAGDYTVFASMLSSGVTLSTSQSVQIRVRKNGSDVLCQSVTFGNGVLNSYGVITGKTFRVNAGDYIEIQGYSDVSTTTSAGAAHFNYFSVVKESSTSSSVYPSISMSAGKTTGSHTASGSWQDVTSWDSPLMDRGGNFNATTGVYTVNEPGDYDIFGSISFVYNATGNRAVRIYYNNSIAYSGGEVVPSATTLVTIPFGKTLPCKSGDTIRIQAFQNSGVSVNYDTFGYSSLSICKRVSTADSPINSVPVGSIFSWMGGYFGNGSNGSFTSTLGNTVANANTYLNPLGYYVCDGSAINIAGSQIFGGASRYLPNLTDSRFLMGSTSVGSTGGENSTSLATTNLPSHTHGAGSIVTSASTTGASGSHSHTPAANTILFTTGSGTAVGTGGSVGVWQAYEIGYPASSTIGDHTHSIPSLSTSGSTASAGSGTAFENRPLYLSAFYIMRVK